MARQTKTEIRRVAVDTGHEAAHSAERTGAPSDLETDSALAPLRASDARVPLLFMASGAAGLIYQVVWTRDLVLVFGNTTQAIVTTVTAFLAGLGIGSLLGAALGPRLRRALVVYGVLEATVAGLALLMPLAFGLIATVFRNAYLSLPAGEVALIRFALAFGALTPVTLIMGMTLPVLTRHLVRADPDIGERIARLYGLNTLGAVAGTVTSGYLLIEFLGLRGTTFVAVALNVGAGVGALLIARAAGKAGHAAAPAPAHATAAAPLTATASADGAGTAAADGIAPPTSRPDGRRQRLRRRQWLLLGVTFASGFVSLALEMLWTRVLLQRTGSSIYVFVAVLAVFLIGIAGGSLVYRRRQHRAPQIAVLGGCLAVAAGLALGPLILSNLNGPPALPIAVILVLPVTLLLGYTFPLTARLFAASAAEASRGVGLVYAANTAGCVAGTVTAGFLLIPTLGTNTAIITVCTTQAAIGTALAAACAPRRRLLLAGIGACLTVAVAVMNVVPAARLTYVQRLFAATGQPQAHFEDNVAMVDVRGGPPKTRRLLINGVPITVLTIDTKLLAYLPKVLRPDASTMLNICFGMGTTYRSSIILGLRTDAVELDPTVPTVMPWFYPDANRYLHNPLGHIIINDGRNYVRLSSKHYDLITIDTPPPVWGAGTVVLMTREFYQEARQRLNPGGVLTSFVTYTNTVSQKLLLRTFRSAFRHMTVIRGSAGMYLIGSDAPLTFRASTIRHLFGSRAVQADLASAPDYHPVPVSSWPSFIHQRLWLTDRQVDAYTGPGPLVTDDHPRTEYFLIHDVGSRSQAFEQRSLRLVLAVMSLLGLLVIVLGLDARRRRTRLLRGTPGSD